MTRNTMLTRNCRPEYSAAKEAAAKEEQIALFSLGVKSMPWYQGLER
jgi:hypothetical protein